MPMATWGEEGGKRGVLLSPSRTTAQWTEKLPTLSSLRLQGKKDICSLWYIKASLETSWVSREAEFTLRSQERAGAKGAPLPICWTLGETSLPGTTPSHPSSPRLALRSRNEQGIKVWRFQNNLDAGGYLDVGPNTVFHIKQGPGKCTKVNWTRPELLSCGAVRRFKTKSLALMTRMLINTFYFPGKMMGLPTLLVTQIETLANR